MTHQWRRISFQMDFLGRQCDSESSLFWLCKGTLEWECWGPTPVVYTHCIPSDPHSDVGRTADNAGFTSSASILASGLSSWYCLLSLHASAPSPHKPFSFSAAQPPFPVPSPVPLGHWAVGCRCMGIHFQQFRFYDVQPFKAHWHLFPKIDVDTSPHKLMFSSQLICLEGVNLYAKQNNGGGRRKGKKQEDLFPVNLPTTQELEGGRVFVFVFLSFAF